MMFHFFVVIYILNIFSFSLLNFLCSVFNVTVPFLLQTKELFLQPLR